MSVSSLSEFDVDISQASVSQLTKYLDELLKEIDLKTVLLKSSSPHNTLLTSDCYEDNSPSNTVQYAVIPT